MPRSVCVNVPVGERHLRPTLKVTPVTGERTRTGQRMEKWREGRVAVRALWICAAIAVTVAFAAARSSRQRSGPVPVPVPVEHDSVFLLEDVVQPPCFAEERVRLCDLGLLVGVAVHLERRLTVRFGGKRRKHHVRSKEKKKGRRKKGSDEGGKTDLAVLVRLTNVEERASAALVLFTAHDGVHRA